MNGRQAWATLIFGIIAWELYAARGNRGDLLSEVVDDWLIKRPISVRVAILLVAFHLVNWLPWPIDPLSQRLWIEVCEHLRGTAWTGRALQYPTTRTRSASAT